MPGPGPLAAAASWETALGERAAATTDGPADQVGQRQSLLQALMTLPAGQRQVVVLRFLEDLPVAETAAILGISEGTVKSYTSRALFRLRSVLDDAPAAGGRGSPEVFHAH